MVRDRIRTLPSVPRISNVIHKGKVRPGHWRVNYNFLNFFITLLNNSQELIAQEQAHFCANREIPFPFKQEGVSKGH